MGGGAERKRRAREAAGETDSVKMATASQCRLKQSDYSANWSKRRKPPREREPGEGAGRGVVMGLESEGNMADE